MSLGDGANAGELGESGELVFGKGSWRVWSSALVNDKAAGEWAKLIGGRGSFSAKNCLLSEPAKNAGESEKSVAVRRQWTAGTREFFESFRQPKM